MKRNGLHFSLLSRRYRWSGKWKNSKGVSVVLQPLALPKWPGWYEKNSAALLITNIFVKNARWSLWIKSMSDCNKSCLRLELCTAERNIEPDILNYSFIFHCNYLSSLQSFLRLTARFASLWCHPLWWWKSVAPCVRAQSCSGRYNSKLVERQERGTHVQEVTFHFLCWFPIPKRKRQVERRSLFWWITVPIEESWQRGVFFRWRPLFTLLAVTLTFTRQKKKKVAISSTHW